MYMRLWTITLAILYAYALSVELKGGVTQVSGVRKVIAMTAYDRPAYLAETLESFRGDEDWERRIHVDPSEDHSVAARVLNAAAQRFRTEDIVLNDIVFGPEENPRLAIEAAFVEDKADVVLYVQDDVRLSPDAFQLANWFAELPDRDSYFALFLLAYESDPNSPNLILETRGEQGLRAQRCRFHSGGAFVFSRRQWEDRINANWYGDRRGSDWSLGELMQAEPDLIALVPALSRCNHIGRLGGAHIRPRAHDRMFGHLPCSELRNLPELSIVAYR